MLLSLATLRDLSKIIWRVKVVSSFSNKELPHLINFRCFIIKHTAVLVGSVGWADEATVNVYKLYCLNSSVWGMFFFFFMVQENLRLTTCAMIEISFWKTIKKWIGAYRYMFILTGKMILLQTCFCLLNLNLVAIMPVKVTSKRYLWRAISLQKTQQKQIFSFCPFP